MKCLFDKIEISSSSAIGKKDKKNINKYFNKEILYKDKDYNLVKLKNRSNLIVREKIAILFYFNGMYIPTLKFLNEESFEFPVVYLDEGAVNPLQRGANVMAPGIYKYFKQSQGDFKKNDIVIVNILKQGIFAIGQAIIDKTTINKDKIGEAICILHIKSDDLYNLF
ncbi:rna-binding protein [Vairimorpha apis BRL 01]|uniref:Rna-binding protein n=1 Tax=Vairimorpha apis BRL 01 TaxID=1037528 RepID=T0KZ99_9MICR|nr:rna-binding protein [Vairimorpha apis BRL 01]